MEVITCGFWEGAVWICEDACCPFSVMMNANRQTLPNPSALNGQRRLEQLATTSACYLACLPRPQKLWRYHSRNTTRLYSTV
jgi:hypothetical protein